ncbi:thioredoxin domain-containing protein [Halochromatium salexigens]|uniref:Thioredoxin domain-containing protein n=1 Tax=Halochromatium salexigens TaxID=49447 RepID=A0AAJ0UIT7_HALSE|nr:thioredoxin domain-containing protein [Halochromatium salexigens]MBK5931312.1 thioredoxin domain-containing protein [Halochromatium salexigens]
MPEIDPSTAPPSSGERNRLAETTSPYLQQHAENPVHWWPWCEEALALARAEDRPILLSIGYSACHWCHVMAHESFEDETTAKLMNRLFVNIKVDREERPDLDKIYQTAHQLLAQRTGGWPLTVFLTPDDLAPFFAGTYFPNTQRHGLPSFQELLIGVERAYREQQDAIREQNASLRKALSQLDGPNESVGEPLSDLAPLDQARRQLAGSFDTVNGGFGRAPKFPHPTNLELLLRHYAATAAAGSPDQQAREMALFTLERMVRGGLNDQLGGGFCRYSVDDQWMIPHFEKMLYDNGPLLTLCCDAWQLSGEALFRDAAIGTADWVIAEMQSEEGGYFSALDADSEGEEGRFYVWDRDQIAALLSAEELALITPLFGLDQAPNFEGRWHLRSDRTLAEVATEQGLDPDAAAALLASAKAKLLAARAERVRPGRDEKVLTSWNALMIKGMLRAGRLLGREGYLDSADRALGFMRARLWRDGRLLATYKDGKAHLNAYLDDHAFLLDALLERLQTRFQPADLDWARAIAEVLLAQFQDDANGGFYFTSADHEALLQRPKPMADESTPSGNGIAALALQRLGHLLGEPRYLDAAARTLGAAAEPIRRLPYAHGTLLMALDEQLSPPEMIVIRGAMKTDAATAAPGDASYQGDALSQWQTIAHHDYAPRRLTLAIPAEVTELPPALAAMRPGERVRAYRCRGTQCQAPIERFEQFAEAVDLGMQ